MTIERRIVCDVCKTAQVQVIEGEGFKGWGAVQGVNFNGVDNPTLCPDHLKVVMDTLDKIAKE
jgi:hypothetical protein